MIYRAAKDLGGSCCSRSGGFLAPTATRRRRIHPNPRSGIYGRMAGFLRWIFIVSFWIPAAWAAQFTTASNEISCRLDPPAKYGVPDGTVADLIMSGGMRLQSVAVSGSGRVTFSGLSPGKYTVSVRAKGFLPVDEEVDIPAGYARNVVNVLIRLRPRLEPEGGPPRKVERTVGIGSLRVPENALDELRRAEDAASKGHLAEAVEHAEKAAQLYPDYFEAYNNLAVYQSQLGRQKQAVQTLLKAVSLQPDAVGANLNLGRVLIDLNRPQEAVLYLRHAAEVDKTAAEIQYHFARALILCRRLPDAVQPLKRALAAEPPVSHAQYLLANVLYQLGDLAGAVQELQGYLKTNPRNAEELSRQLQNWRKQAAAVRG